MINRNYGRAVKPSFIPKFSDPDIIRAVLNSEIWKCIFLRDKKAVWIFLKALVLLKMEMFISPLRSLLRFGHGKRTTGIFILIMSALMMIAFNSQSILGYLATFLPLVAPVIPFFMTGDQMTTALFLDIRSEYLLYFWMVYVVISAFHLFCIYRGIGTVESFPTKRGTSLLHLILFKHVKVPEYVVQLFIEPILVGLTGYLLCVSNTDFTLGLFLIISGICLCIQECYDAVSRFAMSG